MKTIKKYIEIYKLNKQISHLHKEIVPPFYVGQSTPRFREDERTFILRNTMNDLIDERELIKNS